MTSNRKISRVGLSLWVGTGFLLSSLTPGAAALVTFGDQTGLFFNGSATVQWNDNIFLQPDNEESDLIYILSPGLELNVGARANANVNLFFRQDFFLYHDNSELDSDQSNAFLESYWNQPRLDLRFNASYQQLVQVTPDLARASVEGTLVERDLYNANLRGEYDISELTSASLGFAFTRLDFKSVGFVDRDTFAVPVNFYYAATPQLDLSAGYRYRYTENKTRRPFIGFDLNGDPVFGAPQSVPNTTDHYFNLGARGELAPKLVGEARAGYQYREVENGPNRDTVSLSADFSHFTTPNTTLLFGLSRDFETGGLGITVTATGGSLGVRHTFSHLMAGSAGINYYERRYDRNSPDNGRKDETLDLNVGVSYSPIVYVDLSANYIYRTNDSSVQQFEFTNNIFSLSAALRY